MFKLNIKMSTTESSNVQSFLQGTNHGIFLWRIDTDHFFYKPTSTGSLLKFVWKIKSTDQSITLISNITEHKTVAELKMLTFSYRDRLGEMLNRNLLYETIMEYGEHLLKISYNGITLTIGDNVMFQVVNGTKIYTTDSVDQAFEYMGLMSSK